jgi:predicted transcriptional regulator
MGDKPRQVFREMMGVGDEADYEAAVAAVREGLADMEAGRTRPIADFFRDFDAKYGLPHFDTNEQFPP